MVDLHNRLTTENSGKIKINSNMFQIHNYHLDNGECILFDQ